MELVSMAAFELSDRERKFLRLALCGSAQGAEITTSAQKLIESWRARGVESALIENALEGDHGAEVAIRMSRPDYGLVVCPFKKHKGELLMDIEPSYLRWILGWIKEDYGRAVRFKDFAYAVEQFLQQGS
jgi:hypothetical protein